MKIKRALNEEPWWNGEIRVSPWFASVLEKLGLARYVD